MCSKNQSIREEPDTSSKDGLKGYSRGKLLARNMVVDRKLFLPHSGVGLERAFIASHLFQFR